MAQAFDFAGITNIVGAPSFAQFAKGGSREGMRDGVCAEGTKVVVGSIATRACRDSRRPGVGC